ncbi:MAG: sulfurtransferase TusA family protein [Actinobacteria bacterium]|nr:MAG: sulfurtransferase TusA family protein [Actinomycetota bacterium]
MKKSDGGLDLQADKTLDCTGLYCPMPIVKTSLAIEELEDGQVLEVLADDVGIVDDMPAWCKTTGNECLSIEEQDGEYKVYVRKRSRPE